jgi:hypothetical protein
MNSLFFLLLPVAIQAITLQRRSAPSPLIRPDEFHRLPTVARALHDAQVAQSLLDGPGGHGPPVKTLTPQEQLTKMTAQIMKMMGGFMLPPIEPVRPEILTPLFVKTAIRKKVRYGPFDTGANSVSFPCLLRISVRTKFDKCSR